MSRPLWDQTPLANGQQGWDATVNTMLSDGKQVILGAPIPLYQHTGDETDIATSFPPSAFDRCMCWVDHTTLGWVLMYSDGTAWRVYGRAADVPDSTAATLTDLKNDVNALLAVLRAGGVLGVPTP